MKKLKYAVLARVGCGANTDTAKSTTSTTSVTCTTSSKTSAASRVSSSTRQAQTQLQTAKLSMQWLLQKSTRMKLLWLIRLYPAQALLM